VLYGVAIECDTVLMSAVSGSPFGDKGVPALAKALEFNCTLTTLDLSCAYPAVVLMGWFTSVGV
jgi:hypothetical protein